MIRNNAYYELFASYTVPNPDQVGYWIDLGANSKGKIVKVYNENLRQWVKVLDASSEDAVSPFIGSNGNWWVDNRDTGIPAAGKNPYIGENGNWYVYDPLSKKFVDTGIIAKGRSAYEIAVEHGFQGTEDEWLESLKQPALDAAQVALDAAERANEEVEKLQGIYQQVTDALDLVAEATENANTAAQSANDAADRSNLIASNPPKIVNETWYMFDEESNEYVSTGIKAIGDAFTIVKTYTSIEEMQADYSNPEVGIGQFVMIDTGDVNNPEDSQLYLKGETEWKFISDLSGAQGIQGLSAYQVAVQEGFVGSEEEWVESLSKDSKEAAQLALQAKEQVEQTEQAVKDAEALRVTAESERVAAESSRVTAEQQRVTQEEKRQKNIQTAIKNTETAVENTNVAIANAEAATENANTQADRAKEFSDNPPKIQDNFWYIWDEATDTYVNTNVQAKGEKGDQGLPGESYTLPIASSTTLGGIKVGAGLQINAETGVLNATGGGTADAIDWENITSKPDFSAVATSGDYNDLINTPDIPDISNLATKNEVALKANSSDVYTKSETYTKTETDNAIKQASATVFKYKGTVDSFDFLPTLNVSVGDVYTLADTNEEYVATTASPDPVWEYLGVKVDLSDYSTTVENDTKYQPKGDYITEIPSEYITEDELTDKDYATNTALTEGLAQKLNTDDLTWSIIDGKPTTLAGYGIKASDVLTTLKTVDGSESGLDADLLDGHNSNYFVISTNVSEVDFNAITTSGVYRYGYTTTNGATNGPSHQYGQMLVLHGGGDTIAQIAFPYADSKNIEFRAGNPSDVGGAGSWFNWKKLAFTTDNVASASKLSPGCYLWGNKFTGENDITGSMTVSAFFEIKKTDGNSFIRSTSSGETLIEALGNKLTLGYKGTSSIVFWAGNGGAGIAGSRVGEWTTAGLCVGGKSHDAKLHVVGDGLFESRGFPSISLVSKSYGAEKISIGRASDDDTVIRNYKSDGGHTDLRFNHTRLFYNGNFGLGTLSPSAKLHVVGDGLFTGKLHFTSGAAQLVRDDCNYAFISLGEEGNTVIRAANNATLSLGYGGQTQSLDFYVNTEDLTSKDIGRFSRSGLTVGSVSNAKAMLDVRGDGLFTGKITSNNKEVATKYPISTKTQTATTGTLTLTLNPNVYYKISNYTTLNLTLGTTDAAYMDEFMFEFTTGSSATTLTLPDAVKWMGGSAPTIAASKTYQVSIVNNLAIIAEF